MLARYYSSSLGRFMAVDPAARSVQLMNPQTWNRYTYALNNPVVLIDPDGRFSLCSWTGRLPEGQTRLVGMMVCFSADATAGIIVTATGAATLNPVQAGAGVALLVDSTGQLLDIIDYAKVVEDRNADQDGDKIINYKDPDIDGDGTPNERDPDPRDPNFGGQEGETAQPKDSDEPKDPDESEDPDEPKEPGEPGSPDAAKHLRFLDKQSGQHVRGGSFR